MTLARLLQSAAIAAIAIVATVLAIRLAWRAIAAYRISRAGPRRLRASRHLIWRDPGDVAALDLAHGPGGPDLEPRPPFRFVEEHLSGSQPCVGRRRARATLAGEVG